MKYFIDCEFLEGTQKEKFPINLFRKETKPTIDLISIGIVSEDNREYFAISKDFNLKEAWNRFDIIKGDSTMVKSIGNSQYKVKNYWIRKNVLKPIHEYLCSQVNIYGKTYHSELFAPFTYKSMKNLLRWYGKTNKQIAEEVKEFIYINEGNCCKNSDKHLSTFKSNIKFYAYYANYDWVVFCWLFGKMIDLPAGFPMYCIDLKQMLDEKADGPSSFELSKLAHSDRVEHNVYATYDTGVLKCSKTDLLKNALNYPKQTGEHNALSDAHWNKKLYEFLNRLKW